MSAPRRIATTWAWDAAFFGVLVATGLLSWLVVFPPVGAPAFWLPNGISIAVLVRSARRRWLHLLPLVFASSFAVELIKETPLVAILFWASAEVIEVSVAASILVRFAGPSTTLARLRDVLVLAAGGAFVGPLLGGLWAALSSPWLADVSYLQLLATWLLIDGLGTFLMAPLILTWSGPPWARPTWREALATIGTVAALTALFALVFDLPDPTLRVILLAFTTFPLLSWAGLRRGPSGAATAAAAFGGVALFQTLLGGGPFAPIATLQNQLLAVQGFMVLASFTALVLAAIGEERRRAARSSTVLLEAATALAEKRSLSDRLARLAGCLTEHLAPGAAVFRLVDGRYETLARAAVDARVRPALEPTEATPTPTRRSLALRGGSGHLGLLVLASTRPLDPEVIDLGAAVADRVASVLETERLRAERAEHLRRLEESVALLDTLLRTAPVGLGFVDPELRLVQANETLACLGALEGSAPRGETLAAAMPGLHERFAPLLRQALQTGHPVTDQELSVAAPAGRGHFLCSFYPVQVAGGPPLGVGIVVVDITARKREEEALAASEERFRSLAQASAEVVWVNGPDGAATTATTSWLSFTGQSLEQALGWGWMVAIHPEDRARLQRAWRDAVARAAPYTFEHRLRRRDGVYRHVESRGVPVFNPDGSVREWVGMSFDITARKAAEEERARLYAEMKESVRLRDDFLSIASHELKTPLTPLATRLQMLERKVAAGQPVEIADLQRTRASLGRLTTLINDLLDTSRVEANRLALHLEPMSLSELLENAVGIASATSGRHDICVEAPPHGVWIQGDRSRLEQVITNLLDNAIKYSPQGGLVQVHLEESDEEVVLSVTDQGIGIPRDQQARLFDRFFRARNVSPFSYGGLGLGLYISRDIVERHGGRIWLESEPGHGSTFWVALPRLQGPAHPDAGAASPGRRVADGLTHG